MLDNGARSTANGKVWFFMDVQIVPLKAEHIPDALQLLRSRPELALCDWETPAHFEGELRNPGSVMVSALVAENLAGVILGGVFAERGMICHLIVGDDYHGSGLGRLLIDESLERMKALGAKHVHLIVTRDNEAAVNYWTRRGFTPEDELVTLEIDIDSFQQGSVRSDINAGNILPATLQQWDSSYRIDWADCLEREIANERSLTLSCRNGSLGGYALGGSFSFRAQIAVIEADDDEHFAVLLQEALMHFARLGIRRVHTRIARTHPDYQCWCRLGFSVQEGEVTLGITL